MLVWTDLETTGLNADQDIILEVAFVVTDDDLNVLAEWTGIAASMVDVMRTYVDPVVWKMHFDSGLIAAIIEADLNRVVLSDWATRVSLFVRDIAYRHLGEPTETEVSNLLAATPLAGSTVSFDRRFLTKARFGGEFHYRSVDVSSIKELVKRWYPEHLHYKGAEVKAHRALPDIHESINELKWYRDNVFLPMHTDVMALAAQ